MKKLLVILLLFVSFVSFGQVPNKSLEKINDNISLGIGLQYLGIGTSLTGIAVSSYSTKGPLISLIGGGLWLLGDIIWKNSIEKKISFELSYINLNNSKVPNATLKIKF